MPRRSEVALRHWRNDSVHAPLGRLQAVFDRLFGRRHAIDRPERLRLAQRLEDRLAVSIRQALRQDAARDQVGHRAHPRLRQLHQVPVAEHLERRQVAAPGDRLAHHEELFEHPPGTRVEATRTLQLRPLDRIGLPVLGLDGLEPPALGRDLLDVRRPRAPQVEPQLVGEVEQVVRVAARVVLLTRAERPGTPVAALELLVDRHVEPPLEHRRQAGGGHAERSRRDPRVEQTGDLERVRALQQQHVELRAMQHLGDAGVREDRPEPREVQSGERIDQVVLRARAHLQQAKALAVCEHRVRLAVESDRRLLRQRPHQPLEAGVVVDIDRLLQRRAHSGCFGKTNARQAQEACLARWRGRRDSNPQPPDRQSGTLTN